MEKSDIITNANYSAASARILPVEHFRLYQPEHEWMYSHHPHLAFFNNRYFAIWSNGREHEDSPGQRVLMSDSVDGRIWSSPRPLLDTRQGVHSELVLTACGFHVCQNVLNAYIGKYEFSREALDKLPAKVDSGHEGTDLWVMCSSDGNSWDKPLSLGLPIVPNHGPQRIASGRLIISGNIMFPWTDDPSGVKGWKPAGLYAPERLKETVDDSEGFWKVHKDRKWALPCCEGSFLQTGDGVLHMLLRTNTERLCVSESHDNGESWSAPQKTEFSDNATKFHFGRLPDGRHYYVGCPDATPRWERFPLVLSLSDDGYTFDRHFIIGNEPYTQRLAGMYKGGEYGYPHTLVHGGYLNVIISRRKESVEVLRVNCGDLG
ncbi:MAG: hypothetical protein A2X48_23995 [Lentisphaerae bacterium GWF2_49_21]|nr:MAG: hypothetical protein A2X48_23995 [Lentisphaerae bacterium GWF2_49_21]